MKMKLLIIAGARPNFMKIAPICRELDKQKNINYIIVHTGQHYDNKMSDLFFKQLEIPEPKYNLNVGSDTQARQVASIMIKFEDVCLTEKPDAILVVGDVNSTMACSIVAAKMNVKIIHLEAGLRSFDKKMPEEINRMLTDSITDIYLTPSEDANQNLIREGVPKNKIFCVGNIMIDTLFQFLPHASKTNILSHLNIKEKAFILVTLHRPSNVDNVNQLTEILKLLKRTALKCPVVFPIHPRTLKIITDNKLNKLADKILLLEPLGYLDFLHLQSKALLVITDSGGVQEETTVLKIPCITLRENTERPITVEIGTNIIVGNNYIFAEELIDNAINGKWKKSQTPELWDGKTAVRIVQVLIRN